MSLFNNLWIKLRKETRQVYKVGKVGFASLRSSTNVYFADLIKKGVLSNRKQSIDLLDGLDFDFLNTMRTSADDGDPLGSGGLFDDDMMFDFVNDQLGGGGGGSIRKNSLQDGLDDHRRPHNARTGSMDSISNFRMFDNMHVFRGHSFGDEAGMGLGGAAGLGGADDLVDHLYYDDGEGYDDHGTAHDGNIYAIGNHQNHYFGSSDTHRAPADAGPNVELSAYEAHAASLRGSEGSGLKISIKNKIVSFLCQTDRRIDTLVTTVFCSPHHSELPRTSRTGHLRPQNSSRALRVRVWQLRLGVSSFAGATRQVAAPPLVKTKECLPSDSLAVR